MSLASATPAPRGSQASRKLKNSIVLGLCLLAAAFGLVWLFLILAELLYQGLSGLNLNVFTQSTPPPNDEGGGLLNAIYGSLVMTALAVLIGTPLGMLSGTYMAEYGRYSKITTVVRFINDILLSAPSIIIGLFAYELVVRPSHGSSAFAGAIALSIIVIPIVARTTEDMLLLVPNPLREAASALGMPRAYMIIRVAYKAAQAGLLTGILLAIARVSGETAPLIFTIGSNFSFSTDMTHDMASLPTIINNFANSAYKNWQQLAWTGALLITFAVLGLSIIARVIGSRGQQR